MKTGTYITDREHEAIAYAIDFLNDAANAADEEPAKRIMKHYANLMSLLKKSKVQNKKPATPIVKEIPEKCNGLGKCRGKNCQCG